MCNSLPIIQESLNSLAVLLYANWTSYFNLKSFLIDTNPLFTPKNLNLTNNTVCSNILPENISNSVNNSNFTNFSYSGLNITTTTTTTINTTNLSFNFTQHSINNYTLNISISSLINNQTTNQLNISNSSVYANYLLFNISNLLNYTFANLNNNTTKSSFNLTSNATQISNQTQFMNATNSSSSISPITNSPFQCYSYAAANSLSLFNITDFMNVSNCSYTNYCTFEITV